MAYALHLNELQVELLKEFVILTYFVKDLSRFKLSKRGGPKKDDVFSAIQRKMDIKVRARKCATEIKQAPSVACPTREMSKQKRPMRRSEEITGAGGRVDAVHTSLRRAIGDANRIAQQRPHGRMRRPIHLGSLLAAAAPAPHGELGGPWQARAATPIRQ